MSDLPPPSPRRADGLLLAGVALAYLATMAWEPGSWDAPERIIAAAQLGFSHPPGDPFHALLGHAAVRLFGVLTPALAVNLLSVLAGVAACAVHLATLRLYLRDEGLVRGLAATTALSMMVWAEAIYGEVYALAWFLWSATLYLLLRWCERASPRGSGDRDLVAATFLFALTFSTHATIAPWSPALALLATLRRPGVWRRPRTLAWCAAATVLGLTPWLILPLRADQFAFFGVAFFPDTPRGFLDYLTGADRTGSVLVPGVWERTLALRSAQGVLFLGWSYVVAGLLPLAAGLAGALAWRRAAAAAGTALLAAAALELVGWRPAAGLLLCLLPAIVAGAALRRGAATLSPLLLGAGCYHYVRGVYDILDYPTLVQPVFVLVPIASALLLGRAASPGDATASPPAPGGLPWCGRRLRWGALLGATALVQLLVFPAATAWAVRVRPYDPASARAAALPAPLRALAKVALRKPCLAWRTTAARLEVARLESAVWLGAQSRSILIVPWEVQTRLEYAQRFEGRFADIWLVERTRMARVARLGRWVGPAVMVLDPLELAEVAWPAVAEVFTLELEPADISPWRLELTPVAPPDDLYDFDQHVYRLFRVTGRGRAPAAPAPRGVP